MGAGFLLPQGSLVALPFPFDMGGEEIAYLSAKNKRDDDDEDIHNSKLLSVLVVQGVFACCRGAIIYKRLFYIVFSPLHHTVK